MDTADLIGKRILLQIPTSYTWLKLLVHSLNQYVFMAFQMLLLVYSLSSRWTAALQSIQGVLWWGCQEFLIRSRARNFAEARQDWFHTGRCTELGQTWGSWRSHTLGDLILPNWKSCVFISWVTTRICSDYLLFANLKRFTTLVRCQHLCLAYETHLFALSTWALLSRLGRYQLILDEVHCRGPYLFVQSRTRSILSAGDGRWMTHRLSATSRVMSTVAPWCRINIQICLGMGGHSFVH